MPNLPAETIGCRQCGTEMSLAMLCCPACGRLVHADELRTLASEAEQTERQGDFPAALAAWRRALELLPAGTRQQQLIAARVEELGPEGAGGRRDAKRRAGDVAR